MIYIYIYIPLLLLPCYLRVRAGGFALYCALGHSTLFSLVVDSSCAERVLAPVVETDRPLSRGLIVVRCI